VSGKPPPRVLVAAGGTGGHLFPAQALAEVLTGRGCVVDLATDERAERYGGAFPAERTQIIASETVRGRDPLSLARMAGKLAAGVLQSRRLLARLKPVAVVGFGGYPTVPPMLAAAWKRIPTVVHDSNAVLGRANKLLAPRATAIATTFPGVLDGEPKLAAKAVRTGNPVRAAVVTAAAVPYAAPVIGGTLRLVVFGGSQGARVMSEIVPAAVERMDAALRARLSIVQQAREEDLPAVQAAYARLGVSAEVAPFLADLPARIGAAHLVISRSGATTVAELAAIGRPAILVPLPHAIDQDQFANAGVLDKVGGALRLRQNDFTPERLASEIAHLAAEPARLAAMAAAAKSVGCRCGTHAVI
jgi:UDP-N-acetylglucosamine--N-acetylmuramyl-(pentapeptide) pyrophosphoryl-undecaprenol N-acetylglucosamine transferase